MQHATPMITDLLRDQVLELAMAFTADLDEAEDVTQVVLLKVHSSIHAFRGDSAFATWLFRVTKNVALARRRLAIRRARLLSAAMADPHACRTLLLRIEEAVVAGPLETLLHRSIKRLPRRQREVFALALEGMPSADIARRLAINPVSVRASLCRARRVLRSDIQQTLPALWAERSAS